MLSARGGLFCLIADLAWRVASLGHDLIQRTLIAFIYSAAASANNCSRKAERCILVADIGH